jgi:hypothetical protein
VVCCQDCDEKKWCWVDPTTTEGRLRMWHAFDDDGVFACNLGCTMKDFDVVMCFQDERPKETFFVKVAVLIGLRNPLNCPRCSELLDRT